MQRLVAIEAALGLLALCTLASTQHTVDPSSRVDCWPQPGAEKSACVARGCIWDNNYDPHAPTVPLCYYPQNTGYIVKSKAKQGDEEVATLVKAPGSVKNPYDPDIDPLTFSYKRIGAGFRISIGTKGRYVPPVPIDRDAKIESKGTDDLFLTEKNGSIFSFQVRRRSTGVSIWDTSIGGLLFADRYIQIATLLPTDRVYGFGENIHQQLKHDLSKYTTWGMFARDYAPDSYNPNTENLYGVHPFYLALEEDGKAHGVFIFNSNAMEVTLGPAPHLVYRTIGGQLDIFYFPGPTPELVIQQYQQVIGKPFLPAYFALGFQLCRWGYKSLDEVKQTVKRIQDNKIPFDIQYADIDYMDEFKDFTLGQKNWGQFPEYAKWLHDNGMHLFLIFDPAIEADYDSFQRAIDQKARFIEWPSEDLVPKSIQNQYPLAKNTKIMLGVVWPDKHVAFPDFLEPTNNTNNWWIQEFVRFHKTLPFDGIWVDMNEPSNFGTNQPKDPGYPGGHPYDVPLSCPLTGKDSHYDMPPFETINAYQWGKDTHLCTKTLCMLGSTMGGNSRFYDTKSLYGWSESVTTYSALGAATGKRGAVVSRSTYPSSGKYAGHWLGDNYARWEDLRTSIIGAQEFNMFGIPYVGADVCGFGGVSNEELCLRWQQLGAFHSFYRNHNALGNPPQDPAQWPSVANATRQANLWRYRHLPYLFTLHFKASMYGGTVVRPVFFEFPADLVAPTLSHQFMWGPAIIVVPVIYPDVDTINGYLPTGATWYSLSDDRYGQQVRSGHSEFPAPRDKHIPVFVRAGHVIPRQVPSTTTVASRLNEFQLLVALEKRSATYSVALGELFWDDGETIVTDFANHNYYHFLYNVVVQKQVTTVVITANHRPRNLSALKLPSLGEIEILGYDFRPNLRKVTLNGKPLAVSVQKSTYSPLTKLLRIVTPGLINLNDGPNWTISWPNI